MQNGLLATLLDTVSQAAVALASHALVPAIVIFCFVSFMAIVRNETVPHWSANSQEPSRATINLT